jgi:hypothetical protein
MSVVSVGIRAGSFPSKASTPENAPASKRALFTNFTHIAGVNCSPVGETALAMRCRGMILKNRKVHDAQ